MPTPRSMRATDITLLSASDYHRERWRNGAGWTREILRLICDDAGHWAEAGASEAWQVRLSIADIEADCAFSAFPGIERELVLLQGDGIELDFADGSAARVEPRYGRVRFSGDAAPGCRLLGGPTRDFNLMWQARLVDAQLAVRPLVGKLLFTLDPGSCWALHLLAGQARFADRPDIAALAAGDSAWLTCAGAQRTRVGLEGAGEALLIRLHRPGVAAL